MEGMKLLKVLPLTPLGGFSILVSGLLLIVGCSGGEDMPGNSGQAEPPTAAPPMSAEAQELVDQGNAAQRDGDFQAALALYREGMALVPGHPVPQFGGLMAALALGETTLADSLRSLLEVTAPELVAMLGQGNAMGGGPASPPPGAAGAMGGALPPGHPAVTAPPVDTAQADTVGIR